MEESAIAARLQQNVPQPEDITPSPVLSGPTDNGDDKVGVSFKLDDLTLYRLHDFFGETFRDTNEVSKQQAEYIYRHVSDMVENPEYGYVVAKIRELERVIGITNSQNRMYRLYQWLKLDSMRRNIEAEMGAITYA